MKLDGAAGFRSFDEPGNVKAVLDFVVTPDGSGVRVTERARRHWNSTAREGFPPHSKENPSLCREMGLSLDPCKRGAG